MKLYRIILLILGGFLITACERPYEATELKNNANKSVEFESPETRLQIRAMPAGVFDQALYDAADLAWGGRLYDKWWSQQDGTLLPSPPEIAVEPMLWPPFNTSQAGVTTWRCKSCHGWDYRGGEGIYGERSSSYFTKISGIIPIVGGNQPTLITPEEIYNFLHEGLVGNASHSFGNLIDDDAVFYALTKFVVTVQAEAVAARAPQNIIQDGTRLTTGNEASGAAIYASPVTEGGCETCHGVDGKLLDFKDADPAVLPNEFIDSYARSNPWETLHKIRFGQPGSTPMMLGLHDYPALAGQDIVQLSIDVVAHSQNGLVPSTAGFDFRIYQGGVTGNVISQADTDLARGGILYDKWWTAINETLPLVVPADIVGIDHPLWTPLATNLTPKTGDTTWRCKSCHGWDYVGRDGVYGGVGGSYETGIKGVILSNGVTPTFSDPVEIYDFLQNGTDTINHGFNGRINETDLYALTRFVSQIQQDAINSNAPGDFIDLASKVVTGGMPAAGYVSYNIATTIGGCGDVCHGVDGKRIDFADGDATVAPNEFLDELSQGNPWEVLHKIRFGNPGSRMPGLADIIDPNIELQESVNILAYTQNGLTRDFVRGGRLYDNWINEIKFDAATLTINPLWDLADQTVAPNLNEPDSWRCSLCHGWDYRGISAFGYLNDLIEIKSLRNWQVSDIFQTLRTGYVAGANGDRVNVHNFSPFLSDKELWDLSAFAMDGIINTTQYLYSVGGQVRQGNPNKGFDIYSGLSNMTLNGESFSCISCHGVDGNLLNSNIFEIANVEPWRFFHQIKFGVAADVDMVDMPGMLELALPGDHPVENHDAANVESYIQSLMP